MKLQLPRLIVFFLLTAIFTCTGRIVADDPLSLGDSALHWLIQAGCMLALLFFLSLHEESDPQHLHTDRVLNELFRWSALLIPMTLAGAGYELWPEYAWLEPWLLALNMLIWIAFLVVYAMEVRTYRGLYRPYTSTLVFIACWLMTGVVWIAGDYGLFRASQTPLAWLKTIHPLLGPGYFFLALLGTWCLVDMARHASDATVPAIPRIPLLQTSGDKLTRSGLLNSIFSGLQYVLNMMISLLNPLIQILSLTLLSFMYGFPRLFLRTLLRIGRKCLVMLPGVAVLGILAAMIVLTDYLAPSLLTYLQSATRQRSLEVLEAPLLTGVLLTAGMFLLLAVHHYAFRNGQNFSLRLLPFSVSYLLLVLTISGWLVFAWLHAVRPGIEAGYYTVGISALLCTGMILLLILQGYRTGTARKDATAR